MISVNSLTKRFGSTVALDGVSFEIARGEIVGLLGPNGAGKTTMMRVLTGYLPPSEGRATVAGLDVQENPIEVRRRIGYMPETVPIYGELTAASYLRFIADLREIPKAGMMGRIGSVMQQVGVTDVSGRILGHLSKGYRQRVGLAQALLHSPDILILDEPTVGLDPKQVVEIRTLIRELATRHTVMLSSHILPEVSQICTRIMVIDRGRIVAVDTQEGLEKRLKGGEMLYVEFRGPREEALGQVRSMAGVKSANPAPDGPGILVETDLGRDVRAELFEMAVSRRWPIAELRPVSMSLEEVFLRLTTRESEARAAEDAGVAA